MGSDNEYPIKEKRMNESGDITPLVPSDFSWEDEETSDQPSQKQCQRDSRKSGSDGSSCPYDPQLAGSNISGASTDVDEQYLMRSESEIRPLKKDGDHQLGYESSIDSDPTGLFSAHLDDRFSDGCDWADRGYDVSKNEKVGTSISVASRDDNEQHLLRSESEICPLEEKLSYTLDGVEKVVYQESSDSDSWGLYSPHWDGFFADDHEEWADRDYDILKSEKVYYIWVKADRCNDEQCIELLKEAGCNESNFLRRSGKYPFIFYAKMDKEKAEKLKGVAGIAHFYSEGEHFING